MYTVDIIYPPALTSKHFIHKDFSDFFIVLTIQNACFVGYKQ